MILENNPKYRIMEKDGEFTIQIYKYELTGFLFLTKKYGWYPVTSNGYFAHSILPPCKAFKTLKEARDKIGEWNDKLTNKPIYHYVD